MHRTSGTPGRHLHFLPQHTYLELRNDLCLLLSLLNWLINCNASGKARRNDTCRNWTKATSTSSRQYKSNDLNIFLKWHKLRKGTELTYVTQEDHWANPLPQRKDIGAANFEEDATSSGLGACADCDDAATRASLVILLNLQNEAASARRSLRFLHRKNTGADEVHSRAREIRTLDGGRNAAASRRRRERGGQEKAEKEDVQEIRMHGVDVCFTDDCWFRLRSFCLGEDCCFVRDVCSFSNRHPVVHSRLQKVPRPNGSSLW